MTNPILPLKAAIRAVLISDPALLAVLGGARVYDETPRNTPFPFVTFGVFTANDNSTSSDRGHETKLELDVWSRNGSTKQPLLIANRIEELLHDQPLTLVGHHLVNNQIIDSDTTLERDGETIRVTLRFRAVTEVL